MAPDNDPGACMDVIHAYEYDDNLNPTLRRMWKTACLADKLGGRLFSSELLDV